MLELSTHFSYLLLLILLSANVWDTPQINFNYCRTPHTFQNICRTPQLFKISTVPLFSIKLFPTNAKCIITCISANTLHIFALRPPTNIFDLRIQFFKLLKSNLNLFASLSTTLYITCLQNGPSSWRCLSFSRGLS